MSHNDPLHDALSRRAAGLGDASPLTLDDVKGRARGIRRRRAAVSGLAAAAVLAVAVPTAIAVTDRTLGTPDSAPAAQPSPSNTSETTQAASPTPASELRIDLTVEIDELSYAPGIPYLYDGAIIASDGEVDLEAEYTEFAALADGWVAVRRDDEGNAFVDLLDAAGSVTASDASTGSLAVSADGSVVAYATPDGQLMTVVPDAEPMPLVDQDVLPEGILDPVAVTGSDSCLENAEGGGCAVYLNAQDVDEQAAYSVTGKGIVGRLPGLLALAGLAPDGSRSGLVSVAEDLTSCSAVVGPDGVTSWKTCDHTLGQFSPDGRYVIGNPSYLDGSGDASIAILDAVTGDLVVEAMNSAEHQALVRNVAWDTDSTLLMTVFEEGTWSLMRLSPDGTLTTVRGDIGDDLDLTPAYLATQP